MINCIFLIEWNFLYVIDETTFSKNYNSELQVEKAVMKVSFG